MYEPSLERARDYFLLVFDWEQEETEKTEIGMAFSFC